MLRRIEDKDIVGKTVVSIDAGACNVVRLHFSDGTKLEMWAEDVVQTSYGNIPGILVEDTNENQHVQP